MQVHFQVKSVQRVQRVGKKTEERLNNSTKNPFAAHFQGVQRVKRNFFEAELLRSEAKRSFFEAKRSEAKRSEATPFRSEAKRSFLEAKRSEAKRSFFEAKR